MKRGGGLHPARPDCWPPTERPRATPGGLIAAGVTCLSRREGVPPCLRKSPPLGGTLEVHRTSWRVGSNTPTACLLAPTLTRTAAQSQTTVSQQKFTNLTVWIQIY